DRHLAPIYGSRTSSESNVLRQVVAQAHVGDAGATMLNQRIEDAGVVAPQPPRGSASAGESDQIGQIAGVQPVAHTAGASSKCASPSRASCRPTLSEPPAEHLVAHRGGNI